MNNDTQNVKTYLHTCNKCNSMSRHDFKKGFVVCPHCETKTYINILNIWGD